MGIKTVRNKLITMIEGLELSANFAETYYEMPTEVVRTPAVAVMTDSGSEEFLSNQHNEQVCTFRVRCMVEKTNSTDQDKVQTDKLLDLVDALMVELRKKANDTLSGDSFTMEFPGSEALSVAPAGNITVFYLDTLVRVRSCRSTV